MKLRKTKTLSATTKRVINDLKTLTDQAFFNKYSCKKSTYRKRLKKYGDPFMNAPLAKLGKFLNKLAR